MKIYIVTVNTGNDLDMGDSRYECDRYVGAYASMDKAINAVVNIMDKGEQVYNNYERELIDVMECKHAAGDVIRIAEEIYKVYYGRGWNEYYVRIEEI